MSTTYQMKLNDFYFEHGIHPEEFSCWHHKLCGKFAYHGKMTKSKMSMVGSRYGDGFPRIVVVSLDPPSGESGVFSEDHQRTTEYVSSKHEADDYTAERPNPHWAMTQIIVNDILALWGYRAHPGSAVVLESYSGRPIENVSACFAHVNVTKCSMNMPGGRQAAAEVHEACSRAYLLQELTILNPQILLTQGVAANAILGRMLVGREIGTQNLPMTRMVTIGKGQVFWMPMHHPTQQLKIIRENWPYYLRAIRNWARI